MGIIQASGTMFQIVSGNKDLLCKALSITFYILIQVARALQIKDGGEVIFIDIVYSNTKR